ncbi:MAG: pseudouridine synthase [Coriobacteriia bacterium]|nr:pseudouridine synthase [Coriobacteriia bacterium]
MRLQKFLARSGFGGRRTCERYIAEGHVSVNGAVVTEMGIQVDPIHDEVLFDGTRVVLEPDNVVIALNKPDGCYTTMRDQVGRECVADLLPMGDYPSLYHIGRLDRDTTGVILFSTDGSLGNELLHPSRHVAKEYIAQVKGTPTQKDLDKLRQGILIRRGENTHQCAPAEAELLKKLPRSIRAEDSCLEVGLPGTSFVRLTIHEGVKHQVKLMLGAIGHPVVHLHRSRFGTVSCGALKQGEWRMLSADEVDGLRSSLSADGR